MDCMDGMKEIPDKYFELAIVDPPYFKGPERRGFYGRKVSPIGVQRIYENYYDTARKRLEDFKSQMRIPIGG